MGSISLHAQRVRRVEEAFASLPARYLGAEPGFDATFQVRLGDVGRTWEVRARGERCAVRPSPVREPDVVIGTDAATWLGASRGTALRARRLRPAPPLRARQPRPGARLRGAVPAPRRPPAAASGARGRDPRRDDLEPDLRPRPRAGGLPARTRVEQDLVLRDGRRPDPRPHGARHRPAGIRLLLEAGPRRATTPPTSPARCSATWTRWRSSEPTWSATRWAAGSRSSSP